MPKKVWIFLVLGLVTVSLMLLGTFRQDIGTCNLSKTKPKKVIIQELETTGKHSMFKTSDVEGHWVFFMHLSDRTVAFDLFIDKAGKVIKTNYSGTAGAMFKVDSKGNVCASMPGLVVDGVLDSTASYMRGIIKEKRRRWPVWFSACKVSR